MSTLARKRLLRDLKKIKLDNTDGIIAHPHSNNLMRWTATIFGPPDSVFANGVFRLQLDFPEDYPTRAPKVVFVTDVFHPNDVSSPLFSPFNRAVYVNGEICLDILQKQWSSAYNVGTILTSIQSLLDEPNPDSPANNEAAKWVTPLHATWNVLLATLARVGGEPSLCPVILMLAHTPIAPSFFRLFVDDKMEYERRVLKCVEASWIDGGELTCLLIVALTTSRGAKEKQGKKEQSRCMSNTLATPTAPHPSHRPPGTAGMSALKRAKIDAASSPASTSTSA
ncbi:uncharacterized protein MONBRDRAFT_37169 [Monosiga brevicollis MX1]|uniref:UBC core domain-containing protein n=1 Tax=Monosiga brevicollis TaxID=81824 RepID=A9V013_MONBE|nr:uncharacterized protein MONBRDRAFT_37169 [Monosiga brevicollis MX1]EDQ88931.1 predicted protein [Monosiga brevicollis MX1]|eukprot:XP_001746036.1 hypothetical protein [Monosiga brevicollis MX1]